MCPDSQGRSHAHGRLFGSFGNRIIQWVGVWKSIRIWSLENWQCKHTLLGHVGYVHGLALFGRQLVSASQDETLQVWNLDTLQSEHILEGHVGAVRCLCTPAQMSRPLPTDKHRGWQLLTGSADQTIRMWRQNGKRE